MPLPRFTSSAVPLLLLALATSAVAPPAHAQVQPPAAARVLLPRGVDDPIAYTELARRVDRLLAAGDLEAAAPLVERMTLAYPLDGRSWLRLAGIDLRLQRCAEAIDAYRQVLDLGYWRRPSVLYNIACCQARLGDRDAAFTALEQALAAGFENRPNIAGDPDLESLHDDARFAEIAGLPPRPTLSRVDGWRHDLDFLYGEIARMHVDEGQGASLPTIRAALDTLSGHVPELSDARIPMEMQRVVRRLGDGHSVVYPMSRDHQPTQLPVTFYWFPEGLFIVDADSSHADLIGDRVVAIGRTPSNRFAADLAAVVSRDNPMGILWLGPFYLSVPRLLVGLGYVDAADTIPITLEGPNGAHRDVDLRPGPLDMHRKLGPSANASAPPPLWLRHVEANYWMQELPADSALYVQVNQCRDMEGETLAAFADRMSETLVRTGTGRLIVDLRHNNGGNSFLNDAFVRALVAYGAEHADGQLWVLIGRQTFSAAQNLATDIERWTDAVFVGEPTGSRPNVVAEDTNVELPWSGIRLSISSRFHQQSYAGDDRLWIPPDVPVTLTAADYFANRDPAMDAIGVLMRRAR